jgi:hypothetical protein
MRTARTVIAVAAALALMASFGAMAQKPAVDKAQQTTGEMSPPQKADEGVVKKAKPGPSTTTRAEQKKEAMAATKSGQTTTGECGPDQKMDAGVCKKVTPKATTTRAEVKKEGVAATKAGQTTTGEMTPPQKKDEGVIKK